MSEFLGYLVKFGGVFLSGGWGSAVAVIAALILSFVLRNWWQNYKQTKALKDGQDQAVVDHSKILEDHQHDTEQANKDDQANEDVIKKIPKSRHRSAWARRRLD